MKSNLKAVEVLCRATIGMAPAGGVTELVNRLCELNAKLYVLAPAATRRCDGDWLPAEEAHYNAAQNLVAQFAAGTKLKLVLCYNDQVPLEFPGSRLRLELPGTEHDARAPLYLQVSPYELVAANEMPSETQYEHEAEILMHRIGWNVVDAGAPEIDELDNSASEHIESQLRYGFTEGELFVTAPETGERYRGYWEKL
ncbi:hypothetical protein [Burkholderia ambifaria]|uniref:hypothetical protein n=1 Tax=Burkholderia ambifaria TaxID=152480 RepID=UPI000F8086BE|nr:hypothetical protein [Burkholderia ambifaria]